MSADGLQVFAFAPLDADASAEAVARQLVARAVATHKDEPMPDAEPLPPAVTLIYEFGYGQTHPVRFAMLDRVLKAPWREVEKTDSFEARVLAAADVGKVLEKCAKAAADLEGLAGRVASAIPGAEEEVDRVREMLDDSESLADPQDADRDALRVAQLFAGLVRGLQRAAKHEAAMVAVMHVVE